MNVRLIIPTHMPSKFANLVKISRINISCNCFQMIRLNVFRCVYVRCSTSEKFVVWLYCGEVSVHFNDDEFFNKVKNCLTDQYPTLGRHLTSATGHGPHYITDQCGRDVSLSVSDVGRTLVVTDDGAMSWTMRDFQTICTNIATAAGTVYTSWIHYILFCN